MKDKLKGVFTFMITPFKPNNFMELDVDGLRKNVRYLKENGIQALVPCGETGEIYSLTLEEIKKMIEVIAEEKGSIMLIPGVPSGIKSAIEIAKHAENVGADAILVFPSEKATSEDWLYGYYKIVADSVNIDIIPYITGSLIAILTKNPKFILKLLKIENVVAFKYESPDLWILGELIFLSKDKVAWIIGPNFSSRVTECYFKLGISGFTDGISNFIPQLPLALYKSAIEENWNEFKSIEEKLAEITELRRKAGWIAFVKKALDMLGLAGGSIRPPLQPMSEEFEKPLRNMLKGLGMLG